MLHAEFMADDLLTAAQKQIDDAAKQVGGTQPSQDPPKPADAKPEPAELTAPELLSSPPPQGNVSASSTASATPGPQPAESVKQPEAAPQPAESAQNTAVVDAILNASSVPAAHGEPASTENTEPSVPPEPIAAASTDAPPPKPKSRKVPILIALFLMLTSLSVIGLYVQQKNQVADLRSRAAQQESGSFNACVFNCTEIGMVKADCEAACRKAVAVTQQTGQSSNTGAVMTETLNEISKTKDCKSNEIWNGKKCVEKNCTQSKGDCVSKSLDCSGVKEINASCAGSNQKCVEDSSKCKATNQGACTKSSECARGLQCIDKKCTGPGDEVCVSKGGKCYSSHTIEARTCEGIGAWDCPADELCYICAGGAQPTIPPTGVCSSESSCANPGDACTGGQVCKKSEQKGNDGKVICNCRPDQEDEPGQCRNIKIYKDGSRVTDLSTLRPGDRVVLAVVGTNATKGRFRVNGAPASFQESTGTNSSSEFTLPFTIPNAAQITVEAEIFSEGRWR